MNRSTLSPRRWVYAALAALLAIALMFYFLTRDAQDGEAQAERIVATFADQASEACSDPDQRTELARQGFSCKAIEAAAEKVDGGAPAVLIPGPQGERGPIGPRGFDGRDSTTPGPRGPDGEAVTGPRGPRGFDGSDSTIPGPTGAPGKDGTDSTVPGPRGEVGPSGTNGTNGTNGPKGETGAPGKDGAPGADSTIPGPEGPPGPAGPPGVNGEPGAAGANGIGIASIACDSATPFSLTVTFSDGTSATYSCGPGRG